MKNNVLSDIENYKVDIEANETILFLKYVGLIHELFECCSENSNIKSNAYLKHILLKGIKNTFYIYSFLLLYTKNLDLTIYHTQKSILYYIEFIGQISEDNHNFLKLNSKDATLFIYKKTIFDINCDFKKDFEETPETKYKLQLLQHYVDIYNNILNQVIHSCDAEINKDELQKILFTKVYKIVEVLIQVPLACKNNSDIYTQQLTKINTMVIEMNTFYEYIFIQKNYLVLLESLIKKGMKKTIDNSYIKNKLNEVDIVEKMSHFSICKIVNYLLS